MHAEDLSVKIMSVSVIKVRRSHVLLTGLSFRQISNINEHNSLGSPGKVLQVELYFLSISISISNT